MNMMVSAFILLFLACCASATQVTMGSSNNIHNRQLFGVPNFRRIYIDRFEVRLELYVDVECTAFGLAEAARNAADQVIRSFAQEKCGFSQAPLQTMLGSRECVDSPSSVAVVLIDGGFMDFPRGLAISTSDLMPCVKAAVESDDFLTAIGTACSCSHVENARYFLITEPPTGSPTGSPTLSPAPTSAPTPSPTSEPTKQPTPAPSSSPSSPPSKLPTVSPTTTSPSFSPTTATPSFSPTTSTPTFSPTTAVPTLSPQETTPSPTKHPVTMGPTASPVTTNVENNANQLKEVPSNNDSGSGGGGFSMGVIAGLAGAIFALVGILLFVVARQRKQQKKQMIIQAVHNDDHGLGGGVASFDVEEARSCSGTTSEAFDTTSVSVQKPPVATQKAPPSSVSSHSEIVVPATLSRASSTNSTSSRLERMLVAARVLSSSQDLESKSRTTPRTSDGDSSYDETVSCSDGDDQTTSTSQTPIKNSNSDANDDASSHVVLPEPEDAANMFASPQRNIIVQARTPPSSSEATGSKESFPTVLSPPTVSARRSRSMEQPRRNETCSYRQPQTHLSPPSGAASPLHTAASTLVSRLAFNSPQRDEHTLGAESMEASVASASTGTTSASSPNSKAGLQFSQAASAAEKSEMTPEISKIPFPSRRLLGGGIARHTRTRSMPGFFPVDGTTSLYEMSEEEESSDSDGDAASADDSHFAPDQTWDFDNNSMGSSTQQTPYAAGLGHTKEARALMVSNKFRVLQDNKPKTSHRNEMLPLPPEISVTGKRSKTKATSKGVPRAFLGERPDAA